MSFVTRGIYTTVASPPPPIITQLQPYIPAITLYNHFPSLPPKPPWSYRPLTVDIDLTHFISKSDDNPFFIQSTALHYLQKYHSYTHIYTDGSKTDTSNTGFGVYAPHNNTRIIEALHPTHTVYSAELHAIHRALTLIQSLNTFTHKDYLILSDSLSSLQSLTSLPLHPLNNISQTILDIHEQLALNNYHIIFTWVPSHVQITGNETADKLAKQATLFQSTHLTSIYTLKTLIKKSNPYHYTAGKHFTLTTHPQNIINPLNQKYHTPSKPPSKTQTKNA
jgi:ribonuclease HI